MELNSKIGEKSARIAHGNSTDRRARGARNGC